MKLHIRAVTGIAIMLLGGVLPLSASTVTYDFNQVTGGTTPAGPAPWLQAVFTDNALPANTVQLTVSAGNLAGSEFVSCWYFNLNPALDPTALSFSVSGSSGSFADPSIHLGANGYKAGPDGKYDVLLGFSTADGQRFSGGNSLTLTITSLSGLTADDFNYLSAAAGGSEPYSSAAHIQSIDPNGGSGWVNPTTTTILGADAQVPAVPDGSTTVILLGISLLAMAGLRRKMQMQPARQ